MRVLRLPFYHLHTTGTFPLRSGSVWPLMRSRKPCPCPWLGLIEGPLIDWSVKRSLVRLPTCQAVYCWRLLHVVNFSGNCLLLGAALWSCQTARETPLHVRLKSHHHSNTCLASSCTSFCVLVKTSLLPSLKLLLKVRTGVFNNAMLVNFNIFKKFVGVLLLYKVKNTPPSPSRS